MTQSGFTANTALIVPALNRDFSFDHPLFTTENGLPTGAVLPGDKERTQQYYKGLASLGIFRSFQKKVFTRLSDSDMFSVFRVSDCLPPVGFTWVPDGAHAFALCPCVCCIPRAGGPVLVPFGCLPH